MACEDLGVVGERQPSRRGCGQSGPAQRETAGQCDGRGDQRSPSPMLGARVRGRPLCAVIVDRLTFNGAIIQTGTESYRLAHTKALAEQTAAG